MWLVAIVDHESDLIEVTEEEEKEDEDHPDGARRRCAGRRCRAPCSASIIEIG